MTKKIKPIEALAKIKILIKRHYENIGRGDEFDINLVKERDLIENIEEIIDKVNIPAKNLILESFEEPKEYEEYE